MKRRGFLKSLIASVAVVPVAVVKASKVEPVKAKRSPAIYGWTQKRRLFHKYCESITKYVKHHDPTMCVVAAYDGRQHNMMVWTWDRAGTFAIDFQEWLHNDPIQRYMLFKVRYSGALADARRRHNG